MYENIKLPVRKTENTVPVIDSDYYNAGDSIAQSVFVKYGVSDEKPVTTKRTGGVGSTGE